MSLITIEDMRRWERAEALRRHGWKETGNPFYLWYKPSKDDRPDGQKFPIYSDALPMYRRDWNKIRKEFA